MLRLRVLGPIEADLNGLPIDLGGPRQRAVLALLLTARGEAVSVDRMIEQLWRDDPPPRAIASLQAYVSNLRRLLEPQRPRRAPARLLVSAAPGYALRLPDDAVDAWRFEDALRRAQTSTPAEARALLTEALGWWRGLPYAEVGDEEWAAIEVARLTELRLSARELLVKTSLLAGLATEAVPAAERLTREYPLREEGWRLLAIGLWATGRQADALDALRRNRGVLRDEVGLDPGPALVELEQAILSQRMEVLHAAAPAAPRGGGQEPVAAARPDRSSVIGRRRVTGEDGQAFVGRDAELHTVAEIAATARHSGGIVLVTGEPGAGKSQFLRALQARLGSTGWTVIVGRCPETDGAPPAWAWVQALRSLAEQVPPIDPEAIGPLLRESFDALGSDDRITENAAAGRFRLHRAVTDWLRAAAASRPVAITIDDLHRADGETLALLDHICELTDTPVLLVTAYRQTEVTDRLADTIALLARHSPHRLPLPGLSPPDVATLVRTVCGHSVDDDTVAAVVERTGGNPFYVRESARLLMSEGALVARSEVPQGVRDVLRRRMARLSQHAVTVLTMAAVLGREADVDVLVEATDLDEGAVLDGLDAALNAGLVTEPAPGTIRFAHALVRDTLYTDLSRLRRSRMHARLAEVLRRTRPGDLSGLAHHYLRSASVATASLAVDYAVGAAELAKRRYAHDVSVELLTQAVDVLTRLAPADGDRDARLIGLLRQLLRAQLRAGAVPDARRTRERAIDVATRAQRDDLLIAAFTAWDEPTPWQVRPYGVVDHAVVGILDQLLARDDLDSVTRCCLLDTLVGELAGEDDPRVARAAEEAVAHARRIGDPVWLATTLMTVVKCIPCELEPDRVRTIATELRSIAEAHDLPACRWACEHLDGMIAASRNDPAGVRRHAEAGLEIARRYGLTEAENVHQMGLAMLDHAQGNFDEAEARYRQVRDRMLRHESLHASAAFALAMASVAFSRGRYAQVEPLLRELYEDLGPAAGDLLVVALARQGRTDEARTIQRGLVARPDHMYGVHATFLSHAAVVLRDREAAEDLVRRMLPIRDQVAGAATTAIITRPVAHSLGELYRLLGNEAEAQRQFAHAETIAQRWESPHWTAAARSAADAGRRSVR